MSVSHAHQDSTVRQAGTQAISALVGVFDVLADPRDPRGVRHRLASVMTITVLCALAGAGNFREAGDRAGELPVELLAAAGARSSPGNGLPDPPSATIRRVVQDVDAAHADALVGAAGRVCSGPASRRRRCRGAGEPPEEVRWLDGLAVDGKTVRNSACPGGSDVRLFSALLHREQVVIAQIAVPEDITEVTQVANLLDPVDLAGKPVTADAAHAQDDTAQYLAGTRGGDYILTVKGNRPNLLDQITARMPRPLAGSADHTDEQLVGGRRVVREIWVRDAAGIEFPHAKQVFRIRRQVFDLSGQRLPKEYVHGITSLTTEQATAQQLLGAVRHHWRVEICHQLRDVTWREDHQPTPAPVPRSWP